jgi:hypothetical protein
MRSTGVGDGVYEDNSPAAFSAASGERPVRGGSRRLASSWPVHQLRWRASSTVASSIPPSIPSMGRCRSTRIASARASGVSSISTMTGAATLQSSPVLLPRGEPATISFHSSLVVLASNENPSHSSLLRKISDIPRGTIFGGRVGHQPKREAEHFIRCPALRRLDRLP